ncbi:MAG TPA: WecB/TagA/CpsF family glycosyltransferase [Spirochaetia bacterium]|nr:WecB/TagA/CpsF family glycosyltransferase [Spirochaetia bacterium]
METGSVGVMRAAERAPESAEKPQRIKVLDVPVDVVNPELTASVIAKLLENGEHNQIIFLSLRGLLRARHDPELMRCLREAALILPASLSIVQGARFLKAGSPALINTFEHTIRILSVIEKAKGSVYLLGARKSVLEVAEENLRGSFHGIRVVGRFYGYFPRTVEGDIVTAIKKSAPSLVLVGSGVPGKDKWINRHRRELNPGLSLYGGSCFEIFAGREKQVSRSLHAAGLGVLSGIGRRPWRLAMIFPYLYYLSLLLGYRIFKL